MRIFDQNKKKHALEMKDSKARHAALRAEKAIRDEKKHAGDISPPELDSPGDEESDVTTKTRKKRGQKKKKVDKRKDSNSI